MFAAKNTHHPRKSLYFPYCYKPIFLPQLDSVLSHSSSHTGIKMHSFKLPQVLVASLAAASVASGLQFPAGSSVALRSVCEVRPYPVLPRHLRS